MIAPVLRWSPTHYMWGKFLVTAHAQHSDNSCVTRLGNYINWIIMLAMLKCRNIKRVNTAEITAGIRAKITWLNSVNSRFQVVIAAGKIPAFGHWVRPLENNQGSD